jgi:hypothetical protein
MTDHQWDAKCRAAFLALYGAMRLCHDIGMDIDTMTMMLRDRLMADGCIMPDGQIVVKGANDEQA